ncbi:PLP-dependent aminotransferase family protein [Pseudomonadota bacterium AL_CKDN230030165-1A_HGKHYDSX7]
MARNPAGLTQAKTSQGIYQSLKAQILDGSLSEGAALPSTRALAIDLAVSRSTVTAVYEQLAAEGFVDTQQGRRARVAAGAAAPARVSPRSGTRVPRGLSDYGERVARSEGGGVAHPDGTVIDFLYGALAAADFPLLAWRRAYNRALVQRQGRLSYEPPEGEAMLRQAVQGYLRRARGLRCDADQIVVVHGSQQAIDLCARVLVNPGDRVVVEDPCYVMARRVFEAAGARVVPVRADEQGLDTDGLPDRPCALAYVTPSHQFPLGGVMPINRRKALLGWAVRHRAWILEDDYDGEFRYGMRPVDTLQSIDESGGVIYVGTFSKALSPQMRLGYLVLPPALVPVFREAKRLADRHAPRQEQRVLAAMIEDGSYERHVRRSRRLNETRRGALLHALATHLPADAYRVDGAASGLHVVVWFTGIPAREEADFARRVREAGVGIRPLSPLYAEGQARRARACAGFVLGYASLSPDEIAEGVRRLARLLEGGRRPPARRGRKPS